MTVRRASGADAAAIARVQVASWHGAYQGLISAAALAAFTVPARTVAWQRILADRAWSSQTIVFERAGEIAGFLSFGDSRELPGWGELWALYVRPQDWGYGIGSALMADGLARLRGAGRGRVMLWMLEGNERAQRFYQGSGFALDGARKIEDGVAQLRLVRAPAR